MFHQHIVGQQICASRWNKTGNCTKLPYDSSQRENRLNGQLIVLCLEIFTLVTRWRRYKKIKWRKGNLSVTNIVNIWTNQSGGILKKRNKIANKQKTNINVGSIHRELMWRKRGLATPKWWNDEMVMMYLTVYGSPTINRNTKQAAWCVLNELMTKCLKLVTCRNMKSGIKSDLTQLNKCNVINQKRSFESQWLPLAVPGTSPLMLSTVQPPNKEKRKIEDVIPKSETPMKLLIFQDVRGTNLTAKILIFQCCTALCQRSTCLTYRASCTTTLKNKSLRTLKGTKSGVKGLITVFKTHENRMKKTRFYIPSQLRLQVQNLETYKMRDLFTPTTERPLRTKWTLKWK